MNLLKNVKWLKTQQKTSLFYNIIKQKSYKKNVNIKNNKLLFVVDLIK
jgi:hypothetical protein